MYNGSKQHKENLAKARKLLRKLSKGCSFCNEPIHLAGFKQHEKWCYLNPVNLKLCLNCKKPIKRHRYASTCSKKCSNYTFSRRRNLFSYRTICFRAHKKECCICGEENIVEVHHLDGDNKNNTPENLIPLCPTHHQYWHSKFKHLIEKQVLEYIRNWSGIEDLNLGFPPSKGGGNGQTSLMPAKTK
jgi:hypothetical protein